METRFPKKMPKSSEIETILFDIGGVLAVDVWETILLTPQHGIADRLALDHSTTKKIGQSLWHKYATRIATEKEYFQGLERKYFLKALDAEGIPCSSGYAPYLNNQPYLADAFKSKNFRKMYPPEMLDIKKYTEQNQCPENDKLCDETVWLAQNLLLAPQKEMNDISNAIARIQKNADKIKKSLS